MDSYEQFLASLQYNFDLSLLGYKRPQMERRINTLMRTLNIPDYEAFILAMKKDRQLFERFVDHLTINVSEFYRNANQWQVLETQILPALLAQTPNLKVWSAGCSTGEECYTMAMVLLEIAPRGQHGILATDFDARVLQKAGEGFYPRKLVTGIPPVYLQKYFNLEGAGYRAKDELKRLIVFKNHNLLKDKFPEQVDLIICRNVVIYFTEESKFQLYKKFFYSLRSKGVLFTGSTEQIIQSREIGYESASIFFYRRP